MKKRFILLGILVLYPGLALAAPDQLIDKLNLNDNQISEIRQNMTEQRQLRAELKDLRRRLNEELAKTNPDTALVNTLKETLKTKRDQLTDAQVKNNIEFKQSLNDQQKAELKAMKKQRKQENATLQQIQREDRGNNQGPERTLMTDPREAKNR